MRRPSTTTFSAQGSAALTNLPPLASLSLSSSMKGMNCESCAMSSSALEKPVTVLPWIRYSPLGRRTWASAAGPWHTAATTLPSAQNSLTSRCESASVARSHIGPWPPGKKTASNSDAPRPRYAESFSVFSQSACLLFRKATELASPLNCSIELGSKGAKPPAGDTMVTSAPAATNSS